MATKVVMPQLGESVIEGTVVKWLCSEGDQVEEMENILEIETDKVTTEIPSPATGVILKQLVAEGVTVRAGVTLAWIGKAGENPPQDEQNEANQMSAAPAQPPDLTKITSSKSENENAAVAHSGRHQELGFISPLVMRLANEHQIDLHQVLGSGDGGRITKKDVLAYVARQKSHPGQNEEIPAWEIPGSGDLFKPTESFSRPPQKSVPSIVEDTGEGRLIPLSASQKSVAAHMLFSKQTSPHVTTVMEADMQRVTAHRQEAAERFKENGIHLTHTAYFAAAIVQALQAYPLVNSSWHPDGILQHNNIHLGIAVALPDDSLIVPVIRNAQRLSLAGLAEAINDLAERARSRRLKPEEVKGGTFTITNHGTSGSLFATPIINQPQAAILGVGMIKKRPVVVADDAISIHPMVYLSLSFDHRILNGSNADGFLAKIVSVLENWQ